MRASRRGTKGGDRADEALCDAERGLGPFLPTGVAFSGAKSAQNAQNFPRPGALPPDPRQHTVQLVCCAALARAKKNRTPSGDGMESACHVCVFRAKREKFFEALFGVTLHHLNLDPVSSPEALMPARSKLGLRAPSAPSPPAARVPHAELLLLLLELLGAAPAAAARRGPSGLGICDQ